MYNPYQTVRLLANNLTKSLMLDYAVIEKIFEHYILQKCSLVYDILINVKKYMPK